MTAGSLLREHFQVVNTFGFYFGERLFFYSKALEANYTHRVFIPYAVVALENCYEDSMETFIM